jgi:flagellin
MGLKINGLQAGNALRQSNEATKNLLKGLERLASQERINRAADDAAGLAISEGLRSEIRAAQQENENLQSGVSLVQTAEGGLSAQQDAVGRLQELAVQASNGTLSDGQRAALNAEAQQLVEQIDQTGQSTEFNGSQTLDGSVSNVDLGTSGSEQVNVEASTASSLGIDSIDLSTQAGASAAIDTLASANTLISENRASLGAQQARFERSIENREISIVNDQEADSRIRDLDVARQSIEQSRNQILQQSSFSALNSSSLVGETALRLLGQ